MSKKFEELQDKIDAKDKTNNQRNKSLSRRFANWSWDKTKNFFKWAYTSEESTVKRKIGASGFLVASALALWNGPGLALYELENNMYLSKGSIRGTVQKVSRKGPNAFGFFVPLMNHYEGYMLKDGTAGLNANDTFFYNIDSRGIDFVIDAPGWPESLRKINSRKRLRQVIDLCEGTKMTLQYVVPIKTTSKIELPEGEKPADGPKIGDMEIIKSYEKEVDGQAKKYNLWKVEKWIAWGFRGPVTPDIADEKTYNAEPHYVRSAEPSDECIAKAAKKFGKRLETHVLPETKTTVALPTTTTIPTRYSTPTTIPQKYSSTPTRSSSSTLPTTTTTIPQNYSTSTTIPLDEPKII